MNIFITGASKGIGLSTAKKAVAKGHRVGLFDLDLAGLEALSQTAPFTADNCTFAQMNVANSADWDTAIAQMEAAFGSIDVLINNAGILFGGKLDSIELERQLTLIDVNCKGVLIGCHKLKSRLPKGKGKIINLSSASAIYGQPEIAAYSASKFFVRGLTEALDIEWQRDGIRVIDAMPLWVRTDMTQGIKVTSMTRMGVHLLPEDVAEALLHLVESSNKSLVGSHFPVGLPAKVLFGLSQFSPAPLTKWVNSKIGG